MTTRSLKIVSIVLVLVGLTCNQWTLSAVFPGNGFHIAGILEKSLDRWGFASLMLIWGMEIFCVGVGVIVFIYRAFPKKILFTLSLLTSSSILSFFLAEIAVRVVSPPNMFSPYLPLRPHNKMELHVNLSGVSALALNTTNRWGLRGDEPPENWKEYFTIVVVGGSTAQCYYLDDHKTWPYLLQEKVKTFIPNTWVGNGGISGHSTRAHILFVREAIAKMKPSVALLLVGINDLWYSMNDEARVLGSPAEEAGWKYFILGNSRVVQVLFLWKIILFDHVVVLEKSANENFIPEPMVHAMQLPTDLRGLLPSLNDYTQNIHTLIVDLKKLNVRPIFLTQPLLFDDSEHWKNIVGWEYSVGGVKGKLSAATYAKMLNIFNQELVRTCNAESTEVFNLASEIPHSSDLFYDTMHFNEKGAEIVAEKISGYLESHRRGVSQP